jgi:pilus assembly protein CpaC
MTKLRKMGVDFTTSRADGFKNLYYDSALLEFLKWLEENNIAKVLANPEVACVSGRPASFHIGGEFRVSTGPGSSSAVDFRRHGTDANLLAKILPSGDVNLDVKLRVSQLDEGRSATIAGTQVPAVTTRELRTNVTLPDHQSAVMPGLTEERVESFVKDGHVQEETIEIRTLTTITAEIVPTVRK